MYVRVGDALLVPWHLLLAGPSVALDHLRALRLRLFVLIVADAALLARRREERHRGLYNAISVRLDHVPVVFDDVSRRLPTEVHKSTTFDAFMATASLVSALVFVDGARTRLLTVHSVDHHRGSSVGASLD